ncbi:MULTISPECIES: cell division protein ZapE [Halocynthiibacter]|uniref:Cell division protein ZapE n=1 Tax=Halocynthiibacter halioticoli TaxID=2986804 RepID=A0AAE3LSR8_9RHOB|nr:MULTISPECIES: cell division protein ZapE [Halocynthiibacter]MCV6825869.1 cell division protein ZapE [Halocynthiibacter halioticoli]MCW4058870.1 cell division protein ZapE [Halocynthiibacter sp. SDUM655004]
MEQTIQSIYAARVESGEIHSDPNQLAILPDLERLRSDVLENSKGKGLFSGLFGKRAETPRGLYLWGGVGRGKSMLMDLFVSSLPEDRIRRVHFHAFMQEIQNALHVARKEGAEDALLPVAKDVAEGLQVLALDEMQITDIADAMIVGRLFALLDEAGVAIITTSNRPPDDLYKNGLNRDLFLPFIAHIKERLDVIELASATDYRQDRLAGEQVYFTPLDATAREEIDRIWERLTGGESEHLTLTVKSRSVEIAKFHNGVARMGFYDLCGKFLGPADYLAIAEAVRVLILENIPTLGRSNFNEAKRFVTLIDTLYEAKTRLICSAAAQPEMLYVEGEGTFEFERTASRLREMQDANWGKDA